MNILRRRTNRPSNHWARRRVARLRRSESRGLFAERLEDRRLLTGVEFPYHNAMAPIDVTRDWVASPRDALVVINQLNNGGSRQLDPDLASSDVNRVFVDTNKDNVLTPIDALLVINALNRGEGLESVVGFRLELQNASGTPIQPLKDGQGNVIVDADGDPILPVRVGDEFRVQIYVDDLRGTVGANGGVFEATMDISYNDPALFSLDGTKPDDFTQATLAQFRSFFRTSSFYSQSALSVYPSVLNIDGDGLSDEFDELKTFAPTLTPIGSDEVPFVYVTLTADAKGKLTLGANRSDRTPPLSDVLLFGEDLPVDPDMIDFGFPLHVTIVQPVNAQDDEFPVPPAVILEDGGPVNLNVLANDFLQIGSTGTLALDPAGLTQPANGTVVAVGNLVRYTPAANFFGVDTFTYRALDGLGFSDTATVMVTVTSVNDPPVAVNDAFTVLEDSLANQLNVLANDNAGPANEDQTLTINPASLTQPANGTVVLVSGNTLIEYTPNANYFGTDSFRYSVIDSGGLISNLATVTITVTPINDPPIANNDTFLGIREDSVNVPLDVLANDSPGPGEGAIDSLTIISVQDVSASGVVTITPDGKLLLYSPAPNFFGIETFTYTIQDTGGLTDTATVTVEVVNVNDPVTAVDDEFFVDELTTDNELDVLANDLPGPPNEVPLDNLVITAVTVPDAGGVVTISPDGKLLIYTPDPEALGPYTETFQYTMTDGEFSDTATVTVNVEPVVRPRARNDKYTVQEDSTFANPANTFRVLDNDLFNAGATITQFEILVGPGLGPLHGSAIIVGDTIQYQPNPDFFGTDTITYIIDDDFIDADENPSQPSIGVVTITVLNVNDSPIAVDDAVAAILEDSVDNPIDVLANDSPGPGEDEVDSITVISVQDFSAGGSATITPDGKLVLYTPAPDFFGTETFTYTIEDEGGLTDTATVTVEVDNVNDAPIANDDEVLDLLEDSVDNPIDVLANDSPGPGEDEVDSITVISVQGFSAGGSATITPGGLLVLYTPAPDFFGTETFTYTIQDTGGLTDTATVTVHVLDVNDPPTANSDELMALKDFENQVLDVLANDSVAPDRPADETLTIIGLGPQNEPTITTLHGEASISPDGKFILYTPDEGFESEGVNFDLFTYTISDGRGGTATAAVVVDVIDAVPSDISGVVYLDVNNNGVKDAVEVALAGVDVTLTGTNIRGTALNIIVKTDVNGVFLFQGILPNLEGDLAGYSIRAAQPKFLIDGIDSIVDTITADDLTPGVAHNDVFTGIQLGLWGTSRAEENYLFGERGLSSKYIAKDQYLASTRTGLALATNMQGADFWFTVLQGWDGVQTAHVQLASDLASAQLTIVDVNGQTHVRTLNYTQYHVAGDRTTGEYMIYINGSAADLGFVLPAGELSSFDGQAEGEGLSETATPEMYAADFARDADEIFSRGEWA